MNTLHRSLTSVLAAVALLAGILAPAEAAVVTHLRPFGLTPLSAPMMAVAFRLPAGGDFGVVGNGIVDGFCASNADCLLADRGWQAVPTLDNRIAAASGPALTDRSITSWAALEFSADPLLSPLLDLDVVLFGTGQQLLAGYRWQLGYDSTRGSYDLLQVSPVQWQPSWGQVFAVPLPGSLALAIAGLALLALRPNPGARLKAYR